MIIPATLSISLIALILITVLINRVERKRRGQPLWYPLKVGSICVLCGRVFYNSRFKKYSGCDFCNQIKN